MKSQAPSTLQRAALRTFVRSHAGAEALLQGRKVNDLTMEQLKAMASALAGDTAMGDALATILEQAAEQDAAATVDQDEQDKPARLPLDNQDNTDQQLAAIRDLIVNGGFNAADPALRKLISDANKPAEIIEVPTGAPGSAPAVKHAKPTNIDVAWRKLFSVPGDLGKNTARLWDGAHPQTPAKDDNYVWPQPATSIALATLSDGDNVFLWGPPGTGKTAWAMQFAAVTGRPFFLISCDDQTDAPTIIGMTVPSQDGGKEWQDGILTMAIQTPGAVICIDEPSVARSGALMVLQNVLAYRALHIAETGRKVNVAKGVLFISCDNTNGTGGGARHGFTGTGRLNAAFLDRWASFPHVTYLDKDKEAAVIVRKTACTKELAALLVGVATTTRTEADKGVITNGISLRRLFAWAKLLTKGLAPRVAFDAAIVNCMPEQDREAITQQCLLSYDKATVARALDPQAAANAPETVNPTDAGRDAAKDFS